MKPHYTEADLLEALYLELDARTPVMQHLFDCDDCAARYQRLQKKLREAADCTPQKSDTFWSWQRLSVMRRIEGAAARSRSLARTLRVAAAAVLSFFLGGAVVYRAMQPAHNPPAKVPAISAATAPAAHPEELQSVSHDPWQSDELEEFHGVVQWEEWVDSKKGGQS